jgi:hypothetical protein
MPEYRFYSIRDDGHIAGPAVNYAAPDDRAAVKQAQSLSKTNDVEVWEGPRVVAYVVPDKKYG